MGKGAFGEGTSMIIRQILMDKGYAQPYEVWQEIRKRYPHLKTTQYAKPQNIYRMMWIMHRLKLISIRGKKKGPISPRTGRPRGIERTYFAITKGREDDPNWHNPVKALYPESYPTLADLLGSHLRQKAMRKVRRTL